MRLLEADQSFLVEKGYAHDVTEEGGMLCVILHGFPMPEAYSERSVDLLLRLPPGYPNANPDMFWTSPRVTLSGGQIPRATEATEKYVSKSWQRWSRHWSTPWRAGIDGLDTFITAIRNELAKGI